ncbi:hypothetical protein ABEF93_004741 [Exophiala dermatitidis]
MPDPPAGQPAKPAAAGAKPTTTGPKPKPRAGVVRKTKAEREQFAKEEAERQKARLAEEAAKNARGGARGGRGGAAGRGGRGGAAGGERAREGPVSVGSGVFGAGSGLRPGARSRMQVEGHSEMLDGQPGFKYDESQSGMLAGGSSGGGGGGGTRSGGGEGFGEDDELDEPKRDIERIWISSGEEEEEEEDAVVADDGDDIHKGKGNQKQKQRRRTHRPPTGLRPVRAPHARRESEEDAAAAKKKAASSTSAARSTTEKRKPSVTIKKRASDAQEQPVADDHEGSAMDVDRDPDVAVEDDPVFVKEQPSSPEVRRRSLRKASSSTKARDARLAIETIEEKAERLRVADDADKLREFLLAAPQITEDENVDEEQILEDGKLFLFQLPPMTPYLLDADLVAQQESVAVKAEPNTDATVSTGGGGGAEVKKDPETGDVSGAAKPNLETEGLLTASEPTRLPSGLVGKLRVHKSGKVSLDWGGTDMEVRYGAEVDFLQDVVMVTPTIKTEENEEQNQVPDLLNPDQDANQTTAKDKDKGAGKAYALGQVRRKMVLIPDWEKLYA